MNSPNPPSPPNVPLPPVPYYGGPPGPHPGAPDPYPFARRASLYMWIVGAVVVLMGILCGVASAAMTPENLANIPQGDQIVAMEKQAGISFRAVYLVLAMVCIAVGGLIGVLAFPVRNASYGGTIGAIIVVGLVGAALLLMTFIGLVGVAVAGTQGLIVFIAPTVLSGLALTSLVKSIRLQNARQMAERYAAMYGQPPGGPPQQVSQYSDQQRRRQRWPQQSQPSQSPAAPPQSPPAAQPPASSQPGGLFGPAPFGVPPPPDEGSKYGYATRPSPKSGDSSHPSSGERGGHDEPTRPA